MTALASVLTDAPAGSAGAPLHLWHVLEAGVFFVVALVGISVGERASARRADASLRTDGAELDTPQPFPASLVTMTLASVGAAAIHFVVMPTHFEESLLYGGFFAVAASAQVVYSLALLVRPSRPLIAAGVAANLLMVLLWLVTRLVGIPLGPGAGTTEAFGALDVLASTFEVVIVLAGVLLLLRVELPGRSLVRRVLTSPLAWLGVVAVAVAVAGTAFVAPPS